MKPDYNQYRLALDMKANTKTYIEAIKFKNALELMKQELISIKENKINQLRVAESLKAQYNQEFNKYIELNNKENEIRENIIKFVIE